MIDETKKIARQYSVEVLEYEGDKDVIIFGTASDEVEYEIGPEAPMSYIVFRTLLDRAKELSDMSEAAHKQQGHTRTLN